MNSNQDTVRRCRRIGVVGRCRGPAGRDGQDRLDRPLTGLTAATGQNQLRELPVPGRAVQQEQPGRRQVRDRLVRQQAEPAGNPERAARRRSTRASATWPRATAPAPATAIIDCLNKHNERNPGKEVLFLNYAAVDPDLTNSKCSYWHFRLDADTSMKMEALTTFMKDQPDVKKVYLINQNYSHGQQVAKFAKENLARKRPDIQIVGEDLHPLGAGARLRALHRQDQGLGRRHGGHRQLGLRPDAADQGRQRRRAATPSSTPTTPASPARRRRWAPTPPAACSRSR